MRVTYIHKSTYLFDGVCSRFTYKCEREGPVYNVWLRTFNLLNSISCNVQMYKDVKSTRRLGLHGGGYV